MVRFKSNALAIKPDRRKIFAIVGALLILMSFLLTYQALKNAQRRDTAFVAVNQLPLGKVLTLEDIRAVSVDLAPVAGSYPSNINALIGKTVIRNIYANELISDAMVGESRNLRTVAMKLPLGSVPPDIEVNDTIDLWWINPETGQAENLINGVNTSAVASEVTGYSSTITVVVAIEPNRVANLIQAITAESIEVVKHEN